MNFHPDVNMEMLVLMACIVENILTMSCVNRAPSRNAYSMQVTTLCLRFLIAEPKIDGVDNVMKLNLGTELRTKTGEFMVAVGTSSI